MAKFPQFDFNSSPEAAAVAARIEKSRGYVSNVMRTLGHSMKGVTQHMSLGHFLRYQTALSDLQRELVICAVVRKVDYAWAHHGGLLQQLGVSDSGVAELRDGRVPAELSEENRALCAYILELSTAELSEATLTRIRRHFSLEQIIDMSLLSIYYMGTGVLILAFEIPTEADDVLQVEKSWQLQQA
jgi:4-carboxymuconolactone decarboxylase